MKLKLYIFFPPEVPFLGIYQENIFACSFCVLSHICNMVIHYIMYISTKVETLVSNCRKPVNYSYS